MATYPAIMDERAPRLSEALFRFAAQTDEVIGDVLKELSARIAAASAAADAKRLAYHLDQVRGVIELGARVDLVQMDDAKVILAALRHVATTAQTVAAEQERPSVAAFADIVSSEKMNTTANKKRESIETVQPAKRAKAPLRKQPAKSKSAHRKVTTNTTAQKRRDIILAALAQTPGIGMRHIQETLPEVSERTLRYDLQQLIKRGEVIREGVGGPATRYQLASVTSRR